MLYIPPGCFLFFFNDTATTQIYTLSLHHALPIYHHRIPTDLPAARHGRSRHRCRRPGGRDSPRALEPASELQSRQYLVCRLLLKKILCDTYVVDEPAAEQVVDMHLRAAGAVRHLD